MIWYGLGGVLAAVLALGGGVWALRRGRGARIDSPEEAAAAAEAAHAGFATLNAVVGADGAGALAIAQDGRVAAMKRDGKRILAREVTWDAVRATPEGMLIETGQRRFGDVLLAGVNVLDIRRLAPDLRA